MSIISTDVGVQFPASGWIDRRPSSSEIAPEEAPPQAAPAPAVEPRSYRPVLGAACRASLVAVAVKLAAMFWFAQDYGARWEVRRWHGLPYVVFLTNNQTFIQITTRSTLALSVVAPVVFGFIVVLRRCAYQRVAGWMTLPLSLLYNIVVDLVLHTLQPPYVVARLHRWSFLGLAASIGLIGVWLLAERNELRNAMPPTQMPPPETGVQTE